jgi:hypothetical protein
MMRWNILWADLDRFIEGRWIDPAYLYWLTPTTDFVFEIRSMQPAPSIRMFVRFAEQDVLVATNYAERPWLGHWGSKQWRDAITTSKARWQQLFHPYEPLSGDHIRDFITDNVLDDAPFHRKTRRRPRVRLSPAKVKDPNF